jgi:hypothetical protein
MSDYLAQVVRQRDAALERARKAEQLLAAAEDELQKRRAGTPLICSDERHQQKVAALEATLAALREGEEPHEDDRTWPTPAQWIWRWNQATPERRLAMASLFLELQPRLNRAREVLAFHGDRPGWQDAMHAALNGRPAEAAL